MLAHPKYCAECEESACVLRTDLPRFNIVLKPGYSACRLEIYKSRARSSISIFDLKITEEAEYKARPLPDHGLDLIRNHSNDSMISDRADFNFHEHDFEVTDTIPFFDDKKIKTGIKFYIPREMEIFIGNAAALIEQRKNQPKPIFRVEPGVYFNRIYKNEKHIGFGIKAMLYAYDATDEFMYAEEGFYQMAVNKYTDKATSTTDGIIFAGTQDQNWMNIKQGIEFETLGCKGCLNVAEK